MELNELEQHAERNPPPATTSTSGEEFDEWSDPDEQAIIDIQEAIRLFSTVKTLLDYISNPLICKTVSKRERDIMTKVSETVRAYLASVEPTYTETE